MKSPKLILFDIGGVLIDYGNVFKTASQELNIPIELIDRTFDKYDEQITTGLISPQDLFIKCVQENQLKVDVNYDFLASWIKDYSSIKPTFELLAELEGKYKIGLFSNIYKGMVSELIKQGLLPDINYDFQFISCDMGKQKPDESAYQIILSQTGLKGIEILFVDDKQENLNVATKFGWQTIKFNPNNPIESVNLIRSDLAML